MEKLKNLLKSDTPTGDEQGTATGTSSTASRLTGQGSHFPGRDDYTTGSTVTGTPDVSGTSTSRTAAATTAGPEQGGTGHIGTTSASHHTTGQPERSSGTADTRTGVPDYTVSSAAFPKTESSRDGSGTAAIGQTGTYTSSHLPRGDPTSSVVDHTSSDPMTYQKPEAGAHTGAGVGSGAAAKAAGLAFARGEGRDKSDLAGHENPYRATALDPRVDGLPKTSGATSSTTAPTGSSSTSRATTGVGSAITGTGAGSALSSGSRTHDSGAGSALSSGSRTYDTAPAPSSLTTTADPVGRSAEYSSSTQSRGLDSATPVTSSQHTTGTASAPDENQQSMFGKALTAVGLGSVAGALGAGAVSGGDSTAVTDTPHQSTATTGESYTAPTQQGPPTSHHRKESIPTTAYPSGTFDSPRAINPPVGGAGSPVVHGDRESHSGHNVSTGGVAGGAAAAVGAAAVGGHEYQQSKSLRENISGVPHSSAPALKETGDTTATTGVDSSRYDQAHSLRQNISGQPSTGHTSTGETSSGLATIHHATTVGDSTSSQVPSAGTYTPGKFSETTSTTPVVGRSHETDHTTRDTAIGAGAGAAAVGAGAYGTHEYSKREAEKAEHEAAKERAAHEKELAKQRATQQKEAEKHHHAEEKAAAKEERHHQKELEKEEKHHQKELEKEEKHYQKEHEKEEKRLAEIAALKERREHEKEEARVAKLKEEEAEERRNTQQKERLLGSTGSSGYEEKEKERKPSILKRIFKRRKNKDTGEEEEYSSDEDHSPVQNKAAAAAYGTSVVGVGHTALDERGGLHPIKGDSTHEQQTEGSRRSSFNPFHRSEHKTETPATTSTPVHTSTTAPTAAYGSSVAGAGHSTLDEKRGIHPVQGDSTYDHSSTGATTSGTAAGIATGTAVGHHTSTAGTHDQTIAPSTLESTGVRSTQPSTAVTGMPATTGTRDQSHATSTLGHTGTSSHQTTEAITGLPYDASKDPEAAHRLSAHHHGSNPVHNVDGTEGSGINTNFTLGEIGETRR